MGVTVENILKAKARLIDRVHRTPIITSEAINNIAGCSVLFKCEHLQKTGSFKARGAMNAVLLIKEENESKGVITHSSGNHGQALAYAAKSVGLPCCVVVPSNAPSSKRDAISHYGGVIELCEPTMKSRKETCAQLASELRYGVVEPFDDINVINGQGTIGAEIIEQVPDVDAVFIAVGGGGMASGVSLFIKEIQPNIRGQL
uniref:Serine racemase n=1 Tax=Heterorhabditis bacteriophora TaxID=37862 RepID=A0A1I7XI94_HETBA